MNFSKNVFLWTTHLTVNGLLWLDGPTEAYLPMEVYVCMKIAHLYVKLVQLNGG